MADSLEFDFAIPVSLPVPSAPGSASSEDAADAMTAEQVQTEQRRVLLWFAAQSEPQTRHACADALYAYTGGIGPACGRINGLIAGRCLEECGRIGKRALVRITRHGERIAAQIMDRQRAAA